MVPLSSLISLQFQAHSMIYYSTAVCNEFFINFNINATHIYIYSHFEFKKKNKKKVMRKCILMTFFL